MGRTKTGNAMWNRLHDMKPAPFNPEYRPYAAAVSKDVVEGMEADGFYDDHTREECSSEYRKRYDEAMAKREMKTGSVPEKGL